MKNRICKGIKGIFRLKTEEEKRKERMDKLWYEVMMMPIINQKNINNQNNKIKAVSMGKRF